ncbi:hypothetical protein KY284_001368 [Solanum tuberosum]|nr:hypothetical protein KY284_001368 [Solanum tuberosum]
MATGSETLPLKGKVTWESVIEVIADVSWRMVNIKERMSSVEGRLMGTEERVNIPSNKVPQSQPNPVVYLSFCKDSYVGTSVMKGGTRVPNQEPTTKGVTDAFVGCPNIQGKEDLSCGRQGTIAKLNTFTIANEQSVNVSLSICEPIVSLPCIDNVFVESVDTLVDPIDDRIDYSSKIDLCPPSVDTCALNDSSLSCDNCVDQPSYECSSLVEDSCNLIKKPQVGGTNDNVDQSNRSDSMSISFVEDPITSFAHRDHVLETTSKNDMCLFEGELECFNSSRVVNHSLFKYNILFEDDEMTLSDVLSGVNLESSIVLDSYTCYSNPLWCEAFPPKDGNLFLEDKSTLLGKEGDEEESGVCFPITSSSWCISLLNSMISTFEPTRSHTHVDTLEEVDLRDTFLYYLFTYDEAHAIEWSMLFEGKSANLVIGCAFDPSTWLAFPFVPRKLILGFCHPLEEPTLCVRKDNFLDPFSISYPEHDLVECASYRGRRYLPREVLWTSLYPFDPGGCLRVFELVGVSSFGWYYHVVEKNNHCPCPSFVGLIAMTIEDVWLFLEFEFPCLNVLSANLCTTPHAKSISFLVIIYMVLKDPFPFGPGAVLKCAECGSNTFCHLHNSSVVLLFDPMCLNEISSALDGVLTWVNTTYAYALSQVFIALMGDKPLVDICDAWLYVKFVHLWRGGEFVVANANPYAMRIFVLFASPMVLQGMDLRTNPFQEGENDVKWVTSSLSIHELQCFDGLFTRMEVVWHVWMQMREFHALHGNICTLKELLVGQHHAWMIAWSMGGLMKRGGASEECALFGQLKDILATLQSPLARVPGSPTDQMSCKRRLPIQRAWRIFGASPIDPQTTESYSSHQGRSEGRSTHR